MKLDIKGVWKYKDTVEERDRLRADAVIQNTVLAARKEELAYTRERLEESMQKCRDLEKELAEARAEIGRLKKVKYRWDPTTHCWWPSEGTNIYDMVQKAPCTPYLMYTQDTEKKVPEA